jgi:hypothetical protein
LVLRVHDGREVGTKFVEQLTFADGATRHTQVMEFLPADVADREAADRRR